MPPIVADDAVNLIRNATRRFANPIDAPEGMPLVQIGKTYYPKERVEDLYAKLSTPPAVADGLSAEYFSGERVKGYINPQESGGASISFETHYPETGWDYYTPQEQGMTTSAPRPIREMAQMARGFQDFLGSNQGRGLLVNTPASEHRGRAYEKMGFQDVPDAPGPLQVLDNRRFQDSKTIAELYLKGDNASHMSSPIKQVLADNLLDKHLGLMNTQKYIDDQNAILGNMEERGMWGELPYKEEVMHYTPATGSYQKAPGIEVTMAVPEHNYYPAIPVTDRAVPNGGIDKLSPEYVIDQIQQRGLSPHDFVNHAYRDYDEEWADRFNDLIYKKRPGQSRDARLEQYGGDLVDLPAW